MPWFKVDDLFWGHKKVADLESGPCFAEALALWTLAGSWCAQHLTDGHVPSAQLRKLVPFKTERAAGELVRVGLWTRADGGYAFRDWMGYQPSKEKVLADRAKNASKVANYRSRNQPCNQVTDEVTNHDVPQDETTAVTPPPSRPDPIPSASHSLGARETPKPIATRDPSRPVPQAIARFEARMQPRSAAQADHVGLADVERAFGELRRALGGGGYKNRNHHDDAHLDAIADDANGAGATLDERIAALRECIEGFLADSAARGAGCPIAWLARDPARYRAKRAHATGRAVDESAVGRARAAYDAAESALRDARERRDALSGRDGHAEASAEYLRLQGEFRKAGDVLEAAKREGAAA